MSDSSVLISAMGICLFGVMSPGPSFVAITNKSLTSERVHVLWLTLGIALINALWAICALFGLKALMSQLPWLLVLIRTCGAIYLMWFGWRLFRSASGSHTNLARNMPVTNTGKLASFQEGILTNLSNPKSLLFYSSVFSVAVPEMATQKLLIELVFVVFVISASWYGSLAIIMTATRVQLIFSKVQGFIQKCCGGLLILFGSRQLF